MLGFGKKKVAKLSDNSDLEMKELINDIKTTFNIKKLSWDHTTYKKRWTYILNDVRIRLEDEKNCRTEIYINNDSIETSLISDSLLDELVNFFKEMEKNEKVLKNTRIFNKAILSRRDAEKYNL